LAARTAVIVGAGLSDYPRAPHLSAPGHALQAMHRALADAGLSVADVDGFCGVGTQGFYYDDVLSLAEFLGLKPRYVNGTMTGGSSPEFMIRDAVAAVERGACETVVIAYGSDLLSNKNLFLGSGSIRKNRHGGVFLWDSLYGQTIIGAYAMAARRHMHEFGTTPEQLAAITVASRQFAAMNPNAMARKPVTIEDVLASRLLADPLRALDCCVVSDGGGALVITTLERARDLAVKPVFVAGSAGAVSHWGVNQMPDFSTTAAPIAALEAFGQAGVTPAGVDVVQIYDSFTITVLLMLEGLGFCGRGEGGPFVADGKLGLGGALPCNTDGGALSSSHPGMRGVFLLIEAVRQLRGQAGDAQVPGARTALACGAGGFLSAIGVTILTNQQP